MFKVNEYFDGKVKSIAFSDNGQAATIGVMADGEYEFGTSTVEYMTLISGAMSVILPGESEWREISLTETFTVDANVKFRVKITGDSTYLCHYK
jgi:uncharacterized protein YaiE (UPF0345 family)